MLLEGVDLAAKVASFMRKDPNFASRASEEIFDLMLDEIVLGVCFDIHKSIKTGENWMELENYDPIYIIDDPRNLLCYPADCRGLAPYPSGGARGRVRAPRGHPHRAPDPQGGASDRVSQLQQPDTGR